MTESKRFALTAAAGLAPLTGCPTDDTPDCSAELDAVELPDALPDNGGNPTLLDARWLSTTVLELQFSEPLEALTPLDPVPTARFRVMGWNLSTDTYNPYGYNYGNGNNDCTIYTRYYPVRQTNTAVVVELWQAPEDAAVVRLRMGSPISCTTPDDPHSGLSLFYTNDTLDFGANGGLDMTSLRDVEGNPLPDIGPAWALTAMVGCASSYATPPTGTGYYYYQYCNGLRSTVTGSFPVMTSMVQIPCP